MHGRRLLAPILALLALGATPAVAQEPEPPAAEAPVVEAPAADAPLTLTLDRPETGWIRLRVAGRPGSTLRVGERTAAGVLPLTTLMLDGPTTARRRLAAWRCDRRTREIVVTETASDGRTRTASATVGTPGCAGRVAVAATPDRPRVGRRVGVDVVDRWAVGDLRAELCVVAPLQRPACRQVALAPGIARKRVLVDVTRGGRWLISVQRGTSPPVRTTFDARRPAGRLDLLATGDSMIQIVDGFLTQRLPRARVVSDAHISTGISKLGMFDWLAAARRQSTSIRPDVSVVFLGANDGFPMRGPRGGSAPCCTEAWVQEYARRARRMMRSYLRGGAGRVYWLTLPTPSSERFARVYRAVNRAHKLAASSFPDGVVLIDLVPVFTPGGRYRSAMRVDGRPQTVRQSDGVHLNVTGARIAAGVIVRQLRRDGLIAR